MRTLERILVATDFDRCAVEALSTAVRLAGSNGSTIILLHVVPYTSRTAGLAEYLRTEANARLATLAKANENNEGPEIETVTLLGQPSERIADYARKRNVDVIILGASNGYEPRKPRLGLTAERVVRRADQPVWTVKREASGDLKSILCPIDFSRCSRRGLSNAILLARHFDAELTILNVFASFSTLYAELGDRLAEFEEVSWEEHESNYDAFLRNFDLLGVQYRRVIRQGKPTDEILRMVEKVDADLLIMGTHGTGGLREILLGSVTAKVLRQMPCSMLTVRAD